MLLRLSDADLRLEAGDIGASSSGTTGVVLGAFVVVGEVEGCAPLARLRAR